MNSKKEAVWLSLSTIRGVILTRPIPRTGFSRFVPRTGSYSFGLLVTLALILFVPRAGELF